MFVIPIPRFYILTLPGESFSNVIWYKNGEKYPANGSHLEIQKQNKTSVENYICRRNNKSGSQPGNCIAYKVYIVGESD